MRDIPWSLHEGSGLHHDLTAIDRECHLAFEHIKRFIFARMDMRRWPPSGRHNRVRQKIRPASLLSSREKGVFVADRRESAALTGRVVDELGKRVYQAAMFL
jgi:hypothetical protein